MNRTTENDFECQGAFSRVMHSVRTRYSLATAAFLLVILGLFYVGGRIVLVHLIRDAEGQVKEIGTDISRLAYRNADRIRRHCLGTAARLTAANGALPAPESLFGEKGDVLVSLALTLDAEGQLAGGLVSGRAGGESVSAKDLAIYAERLVEWFKGDKGGTGVMRVGGMSHYATLAPVPGGAILLGTPFDTSLFTAQVNEAFSGLDIRVTNRRAEIVPVHGKPAVPTKERNRFGIAPMFSEAIQFYSGGFWELGSTPFEAVFTVRDIAGNAVSMISVSLPRTFSNVTSAAIGRLTFYIAMAGIIIIVPLFWIQSRLLLNPLTEMIARVKAVGERHADTDCPRIEWTGKDEFALLAGSVNRMLETLSARAVAVAQSEMRQKALIDGLPDALAIFDRDGRLVTVTKQPEGLEPIPGFTPRREPDPDVFGPDPVRNFRDTVRGAFFSDGVWKCRLKVQRAPGVPRETPTRHFELRAARMDDHFALVIIRDVTVEVAEHKLRLAAEERALHARKQESMSLLAAGIAHDVNNVLAVVLNTCEVTWLDEEDETVRSALDTIRDAVKRGTGMMRELMTYAGETKIQLRRVDPSSVVRDAQRLVGGVTGPNVIVRYDLQDGLPAVDVDPDQFWKVIFNLIKNAAEAMHGRPGEIDVATSPCQMTTDMAVDFYSPRPLDPGPGVLFRLSDNGPGIRPELLKRIFDPYVSTKAAGRGLGLAIVSSIVGAHGGGIRLRSVPDHGTKFDVFLPVSRLPPDEKPAAEAASAPVADERRDVLVVDDDRAILTTTTILLRTLGFSAHTASDAVAAKNEVRLFAQRLRCIVIDAHLDNIDSVRLLGALRTIAPQAKMVVASGSAREKIDEIFVNQPYDAFLAKPFTRQELAAVLGAKA